MQLEIVNYYDTVASEYNRKYDWSGSDLDVLERFSATLAESNVNSLIDVGCGPAKAAFYFADKGFKVRVIDASAEMLSIARNERSHPNIQYHHQTLEDLIERRSDTAPVGILLLFTLIHYSRDRATELLKGIKESFVPGSPILLASQLGGTEKTISPITQHELPVHCWEHNELHDTIATLGYEIVRFSTREPRPTEVQRKKHFLEIKV